jgi:hypothetical protein
MRCAVLLNPLARSSAAPHLITFTSSFCSIESSEGAIACLSLSLRPFSSSPADAIFFSPQIQGNSQES